VDSYQITEDKFKIQNNIIDFIKINNAKSLIINGYTDSDGSDKHNLELSNNRAISIKNLLIAGGLFIPIETNGFGKANPIAENDNKINKSKNRRVEIIIKK